MSILKDDPLTQLAFSVYENKGVFAVLLGSGLSRSAEIPTGWEITLDLVRRVAAAQGSEESVNWAQWYREKTGGEPNYSALLEELTSSPEERRSILHRYIEPSEQDREDGRKLPTKAHHAIANLVQAGYVRVIVTTNFDRLMENALREAGVEPTVVSTLDALSGAEPLSHSRCYLLKLHGDYKDSRILNTDQELSVYPEDYNRLLDRILDEHGLVICGWSGEWDHALRAAMFRAPNRRYTTYWAARGALGPNARELADHRASKVLEIQSADDFFQKLQQRVETLERSQRKNPLSVDLLVQSAKRFMSKHEHRIQLDELFAAESDRLLSALDTDQFTPQGSWSQLGFSERVSRYESATEPLAVMSGVLGRWGDGSEFSLVLDLLRALHRHACKVTSGLNVWLDLRGYPSVLVFTSYGLGLAKARRWSALLQLFSAKLESDYREPQTIVSTLFLWSWKGASDQWWQELEGLERRRTPLSDHLLDVTTRWGKAFIGIEANFELLFERFEMLGALAVFQTNDEAQLEAAAAVPQNQDLAWMPMGRAGWHQSGARALLHELQDESYLKLLLNAGFAGGSARMVQLFAENFRRCARRMSW